MPADTSYLSTRLRLLCELLWVNAVRMCQSDGFPGALQNMGFMYQQRRVELVGRTLSFAARLGLVDEYAHDAILLMDRTMSTSLQARALLMIYLLLA